MLRLSELLPNDLVLRSTEELPLFWKVLRLSELLPDDLVLRSTEELPLSWKLLRLSELLPNDLVPRSIPVPILESVVPTLRLLPIPLVPTVERVLLCPIDLVPVCLESLFSNLLPLP